MEAEERLRLQAHFLMMVIFLHGLTETQMVQAAHDLYGATITAKDKKRGRWFCILKVMRKFANPNRRVVAESYLLYSTRQVTDDIDGWTEQDLDSLWDLEERDLPTYVLHLAVNRPALFSRLVAEHSDRLQELFSPATNPVLAHFDAIMNGDLDPRQALREDAILEQQEHISQLERDLQEALALAQSEVAERDREIAELRAERDLLATRATEQEAFIRDELRKGLRAFSGQHILVVGGDPHANDYLAILEEIGADPEFIPAARVNLIDDRLAGSDGIIIVTTFISHKLANKATDIAKSRNIPFEYLNQKGLGAFTEAAKTLARRLHGGGEQKDADNSH